MNTPFNNGTDFLTICRTNPSYGSTCQSTCQHRHCRSVCSRSRLPCCLNDRNLEFISGVETCLDTSAKPTDTVPGRVTPTHPGLA